MLPGRGTRRKLGQIEQLVTWERRRVIEIRGLHKYYGRYRAVGPVDAQIDEGEVIGLLGLNGAGKTTTLRVLACDLLPSAGTVRVAGFDVVQDPDRVRELTGYLPDTPPLYEDMTVNEYLRFAAKLRHFDDPGGRRVAEVQEQTDIGSVADAPISSLSHGFRQRVGIAQAIVHKPRLVVLDEPISGLDPVQIVEMRDLVRSLAGKHTVVLSSHILSEISETCDRIVVVGDGKVVASGTEAELTQRMSPGGVVTVTVRAESAESPSALLQSLEGVTRIDPVPERSEPGTVSLAVHCQGDLREQLSQTLVDAGFGLLELSRSQRELEDIFMQLVGTASDSVPREVSA